VISETKGGPVVRGAHNETLVVDGPWRDATPEEWAEFWQRAEQHAAQYASVTIMLPPVRVGRVNHVVVFDDGEVKGDE